MLSRDISHCRQIDRRRVSYQVFWNVRVGEPYLPRRESFRRLNNSNRWSKLDFNRTKPSTFDFSVLNGVFYRTSEAAVPSRVSFRQRSS